jgi:hypothetical protein
MDQAALQQRLDALTTEASDSYDAEQAATRSHWRALVRAYLFWTDCQTNPGFLELTFDQQPPAAGARHQAAHAAPLTPALPPCRR